MEELKNNKNNESSVIVLILGFLLVCAIISAPLTHYKQENLICNRTEDICKVEKINHLNIKTQKNLVKYSEIQEAGFIREKIKGNRYAKGYALYLLAFNLKNNNKVVIFTNGYLDKSELTKSIQDLNNKLKKSSEEFIFSRNP